jgi:hypothetical protein
MVHTERVHYALDLRLFNRFSISLLLNEPQNRIHDIFLGCHEHIVLPSHQMKSIDVIDIFLPLVNFPPDPMTIQVLEEVIIVLARGGVSVPLLDIERKQRLVSVLPRLLLNQGKMMLEIGNEVVIQVFPEQVGCC